MKVVVRLGLVATVLIALSFSGCVTALSLVSGAAQRDSSVHRENLHMPLTGSFEAFAIYESRDFLAAEERERARGELRDPDLSSVPENGRFVIILEHASSIDRAAGDFSTYIVLDGNGDEILRTEADPTFPDVSQGVFRSVDLVFLPRGELRFPLTIRITDSVNPDGYWEWRFSMQAD